MLSYILFTVMVGLIFGAIAVVIAYQHGKTKGWLSRGECRRHHDLCVCCNLRPSGDGDTFCGQCDEGCGPYQCYEGGSRVYKNDRIECSVYGCDTPDIAPTVDTLPSQRKRDSL